MIAAVSVGVRPVQAERPKKRSAARLRKNQNTSDVNPMAIPCSIGAYGTRSPVKNPPIQNPMATASTDQSEPVTGSVSTRWRPARMMSRTEVTATETNHPPTTHPRRTLFRCSVYMSGIQAKGELNGAEGAAMVRRGSEPLDRGAVLGRGVAGVPLLAIARVVRGE